MGSTQALRHGRPMMNEQALILWQVSKLCLTPPRKGVNDAVALPTAGGVKETQ